ncbi:MAG TPA: STAS domain-containing protein [Terracidiphilus sp.]|nr:STAS domain-containing protein [Terracidiphilus sp.]
MNTTFDTATALRIAPDDLNELVRGQELTFVERLTPLVRQQSIVLDFTHVDRVDAAGIAALIALYGTAQGAGHSFVITGVCAHVREVLTLVGLDRILLSHNANPCGADPNCADPAKPAEPSFARSAA